MGGNSIGAGDGDRRAAGKIYGRGACAMKAGATASLFTFLYLREIRVHVSGS
jgi:acetylornithine deacetylase/succinyl-diaminopimelate desuccinylase-like protein